MTKPSIDYRAMFAVTPSPCLVLDLDLVSVDANEAYLRATGRTREELIGRPIFDVHPDNPADPEAQGVRNLTASLERALSSKEPDTMALQKYDVPVSGHPGEWQVKWWSPINTPILGPDGQVEWLLHRVEDVTDFVLSRHPQSPSQSWGEKQDAMEAELFVRSQELQRVNQELREAHDREHQTALALQEAMLHSPDLPAHREIAVRYMPAVQSLNVCGDWYDVVDLPEERFAVAVGDVVGHGLEAAGVMGMLRSALSTAIRAFHEPGKAMDALSLYAGTIQEAVATTAVQAVIDTRRQRITYTKAGHPGPFLSRADGNVVPLDQAISPPLGISAEDSPRPEATVTYVPGDILVLYTDGLVERRGEDIDAGLYRLSDALARHAHTNPDRLADTLLTRLGVADGGRDDIALIIVRL